MVQIMLSEPQTDILIKILWL